MQKSLYTKDATILCKLLRTLRKNAGLHQQELAEKLGEYQSFVSKYESGERRLDLIELRFICQTLGITLTDFVTQYEEALNK